jgi:hypothetical protein
MQQTCLDIFYNYENFKLPQFFLKKSVLGLVQSAPSRPRLAWIVVQSMPQSCLKIILACYKFFIRLNLIWIGFQWFGFFFT